MSLKEKLFDSRVSRRSFLKGMAAVGTTAALYGCGSGGDGAASYEPVVGPSADLEFDKSLKEVMTSHPYNCGGRCLFKLHVKDYDTPRAKIMKITSAGDIPREGADPLDESVDKPQFRACPRGYAQVKRTYQPDRLKYPMIQTGERGDLSTFKRVSWDTALDTLAGWYEEIIARQNDLGYIPAIGSGTGVNNPGVFGYFGPYLTPVGAPSYDNFRQAQYATIGHPTGSNSMVDLLNSKFIISNGCDQTVSFSHQYPNYWYFTKAKEAGIPIVIMDTRYTDAAANLSSGYPEYGIPPVIIVRPQTDHAIFIAMAHYIYTKKYSLIDTDFLDKYCFGFWRTQTSVISQSSMKNPITGEPYKGKAFTVPEETTFQYYLEEELPAYVVSKGYSGDDAVLKWASDLSGISKQLIVNLATAYFETKPSCLYGGWGTMRTNVGIHHTMTLIALAAMSGNNPLMGGGPGYALDNSYYPVYLGSVKLTDATAYGTLYFSANKLADVIVNGRDWRTPEQIRADALALVKEKNGNPLDLGEYKPVRDDVHGRDGRLRIEMIAWDGNRLNQRGGPINKLISALSNVKYIYAMDHFMTPSLAFSDLILPQTTHHEEYRYDMKNMVQYICDKAIEPMYDCMSTDDIKAELLKRLGVNYGKYYSELQGKSDLDIMRERWEKSSVSPEYLRNVDPTATLPSFDQLRKDGVYQIKVPKDKAVIGTKAYVDSGVFPTDTGKINFVSPFFFYRDKALGDAYKKDDGGYYRSIYPPKVMYAEPVVGYEKIKEGNIVGLTGKTYSLQLNTAHHRRRAHSVYDNVSVLKEEFPGIVDINEIDASARGISHGDVVYVYNDWGCVKVKANVTKRIIKGTCRIADGEWYRPSPSETYTAAWRNYHDEGEFEDKFGKYSVVTKTVPVDVGGAPNTLMHDFDVGFKEGYYGEGCCGMAGDNSWNGHLVEISKTHPEG